MKKYNWIFRCYGQSTAGRIAYHQKMGVAQGIYKILREVLDYHKLDIKDYTKSYEANGHHLEEKCITVVIPSPESYDGYFDNDYPWFIYRGNRGVIDMLYYNGELSFHFMEFNHDTKTFKNGYWHTVREGLTLDDTVLLYEYVEDRAKDLIVLPLEESDKYNATGALGVGINKED